MVDFVKRFVIAWLHRHPDPRHLITHAGGTDTWAMIDGFRDNPHGRALTYHYAAPWVPENRYTDIMRNSSNPAQRVHALRQIPPTADVHLYFGIIQTDWDVQDHLLHGGVVPRWCMHYDKDYQFAIRYLNANPRIHFIVDSFDFSQ